MDLAQFASSFGTSSVASKLMPWYLSSSTAGPFLERAPLAFSISGLMRPFDPPLPLGPHSEQEHPISPDSKSFRSSVDSVGISLMLAMRSASAASWASLSSLFSFSLLFTLARNPAYLSLVLDLRTPVTLRKTNCNKRGIDKYEVYSTCCNVYFLFLFF